LLSAVRPRALSAAQVDALFAPLARAQALLIAVSGGPDSTALLLMATDFAKRRGKPRIAAATVDHALRPEGAAEARQVAALCGRLGVPHRTLVWNSPKPTSRVQELAREARYRLLVEHAKAIGADTIVTAHHADDQAETVLFRLLRGSGVAGLRGMQAESARDGVTIARPLMSLKKSELVAFAEARGVAFVDDPSNADPRFARTRLRALIRRLNEEGLDPKALERLARRAREIEEALAHYADEVEAKLGEGEPVDARALYAAPIAIVQRILQRRIAEAGGRDLARVGLEKIETLAADLRAALGERRALAANVAGALVRLTVKGALHVGPEPPRQGARARRGSSARQSENHGKAASRP
jgi:tRNA(Ile)-lysidine synthase